MENIGIAIAGAVLECCLILGGLYMILSKDTVEKTDMDKRMGMPYYGFVNKKLGWLLLLSGVFVLVVPILIIIVAK
ncbi:hypothetical protein [Pseudolactococcus reticulitermitis]|uniref:Uncharacterized protein n=1 Tax=Pseudolactococcus reticulitermitis TaxID=2025039 RepID=A0A224X4T5_9LACT|nr:hypothetical protein [Lactococcus reticulitermitis]GAX47676.1 hypothetical protein RsY01_1277 [Lactococcus reticulitermitis]